jgi:hypothetical protein
MSTLTVEVTQEDIDQGRRGDCERCPIALAVVRTLDLGPHGFAMVNYTEVIIQEYNDDRPFPCPAERMRFFLLGAKGEKFVKDFDSPLRLTVEPVTLVLEEVTR